MRCGLDDWIENYRAHDAGGREGSLQSQPVLTDNGKPFTDHFTRAGKRKPSGRYLFDKEWQANILRYLPHARLITRDLTSMSYRDEQEKPEPNMAQYDSQRLQKKYERWRELHRKQEQAQAEWLEAEELLHELHAYYQSAQWREDHAKRVPIECNNGEYCITSEDTLWDMLTDRDDVALRWMRLGLDTLERK